ncbi:MAG: glutamate racemase [Veillonellales bacterium]
MNPDRPIGVFDSGIGGLTVFRQLRTLLPQENIVYFGDTKRTPYGPRMKNEIQKFTREILNFMADNKVKLAVAACNTITVNLDNMPNEYPFKIIGMSNGARTALLLTRNKRIGIIATEATIRSGKHAAELAALSPDVKIFSQACHPFASLAEAEQFSGKVIEQAAVKYLTPLKEANIDTVILACTHYPFLASAIRKVLGSVTLLDPAEETALEVKAALEKMQQLKKTGKGYSHLYFSADVDRAKRIARRIANVDECRFECTDLTNDQAALCLLRN